MEIRTRPHPILFITAFNPDSPVLLWLWTRKKLEHMTENYAERDVQPLPGQTNLKSALADPANLHLVFILRGQKTVARVETLLKSILYYQGRLNETADACRLFQDEPRICANRLVPRQKPLNIHVIGDTETRNLTQHFLTKWHLRNLKWTLYKLEDYVSTFSWMPNVHSAGSTAMVKLLIPEILPPNVEKALLIDSDVLLNDNIIELWDHFDRFNQNQMIGLEWEQRTANEQCERSSTWPIPRYGINTGVILMHLTRLREQQWDGLWRDGANRYLRYKFIFTQGEQDIINEAIHIRPEIYYKLPCEWHFQLYSHISALCCPVVWPNRRMDDTDCISRADEPESVNRPRIVRLVHFDTRPKPDDTEQEALIPPGRTNISRGLTTEEMKVRFRAMYYQFKKIPPECFR
ncbi:unnamed protein product [Calicophoron daubneyi]|uniref:Uncharacterized protein n=1 Tax=Calicophoron daubneyi TaxID=300641 RepID=A0AAV2T9I8_CALDB